MQQEKVFLSLRYGHQGYSLGCFLNKKHWYRRTRTMARSFILVSFLYSKSSIVLNKTCACVLQNAGLSIFIYLLLRSLRKNHAHRAYARVCTCAKGKAECQKKEQLTFIIQLLVTFSSMLQLQRKNSVYLSIFHQFYNLHVSEHCSLWPSLHAQGCNLPILRNK